MAVSGWTPTVVKQYSCSALGIVLFSICGVYYNTHFAIVCVCVCGICECGVGSVSIHMHMMYTCEYWMKHDCECYVEV